MIPKIYTFITLLSIARSDLLSVGTLNNEFGIFVKNLILKQYKSAKFVGIFYDVDLSYEINVPKFLGEHYISTILHDLITPEILYNSSEGWISIQRKKVTDYNIMIIEEIDGLPRMLQVANRISYFSARTNVLVILTKNVRGEDLWIREVFSQLWKIYIINVGLVFYSDRVNLFTYIPWTKPQEIQNLSDQGIYGNIFYNKLKNLHKYPVKILYRGNDAKMISVIKNNFTSYIGVDGMTMRTVLELHNATSDVIIPKPIITIRCRFISYDGKIHGWNGADALNETIDFCPFSLRLPKNWKRPDELEIVHYNNDVSFNSKPLRMDLDYRVDASYTQERDNLCIMIPAGGSMPQALSLFYPLDLNMWLAIVLNFIIQLLIYYGIKYRNGTSESIWHTCFVLYRIQLCNVRRTSKELWLEKYYLLCFMIYSFLISAAYQSVLISFITVPLYKRSMDHIEELEEVDLPLVAKPSIVIDMHNSIDNSTYNILFKKLRLIKWSNQLKFNLKSGYVLEESMAQYLIQRRDFIDSYGRHLFHIMNECPLPLHMSYLMPRGSPFLQILDDFTLRRTESGLIYKWAADGLRYLHSRTPKSYKYEKKVVIIRKKHLQGAFYILFIGHIIGTIIFLFEFYWK